MNVQQVYALANDITKEIVGDSAVLTEDLSNVVDIGKAIFDATSVDNYVKTLVDKVGKIVFVDRVYSGNVPSLVKDKWEYGSVLQKISANMPVAKINETWNLTDGTEYKQDVFHKPDVVSKFFNSKITLEIEQSITDRQVKSSFNSAVELQAFYNMLYNSVENSMTVKIDGLTMRVINNMIGETLLSSFPTITDGDYSNATDVKAINLLKVYNDRFNTTLTPETCITDADFIRFASYTMKNYANRVSRMSRLFNVGKTDKFTPSDRLHIVMLSDFWNSAEIYLNSNVFHNELVKFPKAEIVPYWQGTGTDYSFANTSKIHVNVNDGGGGNGSEITIVDGGVLAVMFDSDCCGVCNTDRRVTTHYNASAEFYNNFYKWDCSLYNDLNENFVVFFVA